MARAVSIKMANALPGIKSIKSGTLIWVAQNSALYVRLGDHIYQFSQLTKVK